MSNNKSGFQRVIQNIQDHPLFYTTSAVFCFTYFLWTLFSDKPPIPTIWAAVMGYVLLTRMGITISLLGLVLSLAVIVVVGGGTVKYRRDAKRLAGQVKDQSAAIGERDELAKKMDTLTHEREFQAEMLKQCRRNFILFRFKAFAAGEVTEEWKVNVTIRYVDTADFPVANSIRALLREHTQWDEAQLKHSTEPVLEPHKELKIVVVTSPGNRLLRLPGYLDAEDGRLLEYRVGYRTEVGRA